MKKIFFTFIMSLMVANLALATDLLSGDYGVQVKDRYGRVHHCTLNIQNDRQQDYLILNIQDCPPVVTDVYLFPFEHGRVYSSNKIDVNDRHGGYKLYEIHPKSSTQFKMVSYREFANGQVGKPRTVVATKK